MTLQQREQRAGWVGTFGIGAFFSVFILYPGLDGYGSITLSRHLCFLTLLGLWTAATIPFWLRLPKWQGPRVFLWLLLVLGGLYLASCLCSPYPDRVWLGGRRREGFATMIAYLLLFYLGARFGRLGKVHVTILAVAMLLVDGLVILQFAGYNPLGLYPQGLTFHHRYIAYSGEYMGTVGNSDLLAAVFSLTIPLLMLYPMKGRLGILTTGAGGLSFLALLLSEVQSGRVALLACLVVLLPLSLGRKLHRPILRSFGILALIYGCYHLWSYDFTDGVLTFSFGTSPLFFLGIALGAFLMVLSKQLSGGRKQALFVLYLYAAVLIAGLVLVLLYRGDHPKMVLLQNILRGQIPDTLGSSRIRIWKEGWALLWEHPLLGTGPDTYGLRSEILFTRVTESGAVRRSTVDAAHNEYLHLAVCCGLPALGCYLGLQGGILATALEKITAPRLALTAAVLCWMVQRFFGISQSVSTPLGYLMLGLLYHSLYERRDSHAQIG